MLEVSGGGVELSACESLKENECPPHDACTIGIGPGETSLGKDAVSVSEALAKGWNSLDNEELDNEELDTEEIILDLSMALGLKGKMPDLANPAF